MRLIAGTTIAALVATALAAAPAVADDGGGRAAERPAKVKQRTFADAPITTAAGVIVKRGGGVSAAAARAAVAEAVGAEVSAAQGVTATVSAYNTPQAMTVAEAEAAASKVAKLPGVEWAEPNLIMHADAPWPTPVNDPFANALSNVWDTREATSPAVAAQGVTPWPAGGYGTKAPALWSATKANDLVVAVIDTGIRPDHPEFAGKLVSGYDFISDPTISNDGDGRDADPSDPGDREGSSDSSWHGSHVAGTIAAATDNGQGIAGMAPGAKIQTVRVLGTGGGSSADIAAGMVWATGGTVPGVPANPTPAKVVNMSLGGSYPSCPSVYADAIAQGGQRGASFIVAAGNDNEEAGLHTPANCAGAVTVSALSPMGDKASYSNFGAGVDVAAIGGDSPEGEGGVLSTVDSGTTTPVGPSYAEYDGTSMATPAVAGSAALIASLGSFTGDQMQAALRASVTGFATSSNASAAFHACDTSRCGTGALDLTKVPYPTAAPAITSHVRIGEPATSNTGAWGGAPTTPGVTWMIDGAVVGEGASYVPTEDQIRKGLVAFAHAGGAFAPIGKASAAVPVGKAFSKVKLKAKGKIKPKERTKLKIKLSANGVSKVTGKVKIHIKRIKKKSPNQGKKNKKRWITVKVTKKKNGKVTVLLPGLNKPGNYQIRATYRGSTLTEPSKATRKLKVVR